MSPRFLRGAVRIALIATFTAGSSGCATFDRYAPSWRSFGVYKIDINQGNYLSQDMVDKLKVGMTQAQVKQVLMNVVLNAIQACPGRGTVDRRTIRVDQVSAAPLAEGLEVRLPQAFDVGHRHAPG